MIRGEGCDEKSDCSGAKNVKFETMRKAISSGWKPYWRRVKESAVGDLNYGNFLTISNDNGRGVIRT